MTSEFLFFKTYSQKNGKYFVKLHAGATAYLLTYILESLWNCINCKGQKDSKANCQAVIFPKKIGYFACWVLQVEKNLIWNNWRLDILLLSLSDLTILQVNNCEFVVNFFHISHNLTWYSAIAHEFIRIYPVCSTYQLTKQLK